MDGPRIYNLFPPLAGTIGQWGTHLPRIAAMGFDWLFLNPIQAPGFSGSLYATKDHYALNPVLKGRARQSDDRLIRGLADDARANGMRVMLDLVINHTSKDALIAGKHPGWYRRDANGDLVSPGAVDPDDPQKVTIWGDLAELDYSDRPERTELVAYWQRLVAYLLDLGIGGFRCDAAYKVPEKVWRPLIQSARQKAPDVLFAAETLGCSPQEVADLAPAGFDFLFNSSKWWDMRAPWLLEQYEAFRPIAPSIAFPESHDTPRLRQDLADSGVTDLAIVEAAYRQRYLFAALFSTGVMMPMGYEFGWMRPLDVVRTRATDGEQNAFDLSAFISAANAMKRALPVLNEEGPQRQIDLPSDAVAILREGTGPDWVLTVANPGATPVDVALDGDDALRRRLAEAEEITPDRSSKSPPETRFRLSPFEMRVFARRRSVAHHAATETAHASRTIVIQNLDPELDCGRYPVKREVGDWLEVRADIFREGHARIAAVLLLRRECDTGWTEIPMTLEEPGLDRWVARAQLTENTRYRYTVEAWPDPFATWHEEVEKKRAAGQAVDLELLEGRAILAEAVERAEPDAARLLAQTLRDLDALDDPERRAASLLSPAVQTVMARFPDRSAAIRYPHELGITVDRARARFGAWYEFFPRSQGSDPGRGSTFRDCIGRLDDIAAMGFHVVYLPPIHPIGRINRKGRNNSLTAGPDDPGSPYAIGAAEGGHTAIHPELGTLEDFRAFVGACAARGMEVALDFAIQCAPDHPWIAEHPEWFQFRPDGSIRYAENPPKKYQDIVNVDFHGPQRAALWTALRDVVLFWAEQGVRIFRVDNPHTKPIPFWEWMIAEVQAQYPDTIFLSEAFTRPRVLEMLAKVGFTQSYTYFTWRNSKGELTQYLTELTQTPVREYLRPNFFANTPDILPGFLQTGGRPAFIIRAVLAATLSATYGIYSGFELCENAALPNSEEYLDSEKYQVKIRDWDAPGNIKPELTRLNALRRENPALQRNTTVSFHPSSNEEVLFYAKITPDRANVILVAVNLDPFDPHDTEIELPLDAMGIGEDQAIQVEELFSGQTHQWRGRRQTLHLDPSVGPAAVFRVVPVQAVDFREPSV